MKKILFIGSPGNITTSTIQEPIRKNEVDIFTHIKDYDTEFEKHVKFYLCYRDNTQQLRHVLDDFTPDIFIVDLVCFNPEHVRIISELLYYNIKQYIFISKAQENLCSCGLM